MEAEGGREEVICLTVKYLVNTASSMPCTQHFHKEGEAWVYNSTLPQRLAELGTL